MAHRKFISDYSNGRENNYDLLRLLAATLVIYWHSFPLGSGSTNSDFLIYLTNGKWSSGSLGVAIFFVISGFLITQSFENSKGWLAFINARLLRIFPGLITAIVLSVFVLGPLTTSLSFTAYFSNPETYQYLKSIFLFPIYWNLPGVFDGNIYKNAVNGSLWTIPFEILCYATVFILGIFSLLKRKMFILFIFIFTSYFYICSDLGIVKFSSTILGLQLSTFIELFSYFSAGMTMYIFRGFVPLNRSLAMVSLFIITLALHYTGFKYLFLFFGPYLIMYFVYSFKKIKIFSQYGDFSYGLYIYAFPIQQLLTFLYGGQMNSYVNFGISFICTLVVSIFSWHMVEKQFIRLKNLHMFKYSEWGVFEKVKKFISTVLLKIQFSWVPFIILLLFVNSSLFYFNQKPTEVVFPYTKSNTIFHEGWLPQDSTENYRWIKKSASVDIAISKEAKNLIIEGFVPAHFKEINHLQVFLNNVLIGENIVVPGNGITMNININPQVIPKTGNLRIEFNAFHKPEATELDKREMSGMITKISVK